MNEIELIQIIDTVFNKLGINVEININNRKILSGIAEVINEPDKIVDITVAIDKLDKIGIDGVVEELYSQGLEKDSVSKLMPILNLDGDNQTKLDALNSIFIQSLIGKKGIEETNFILSKINKLNLLNSVKFNLTLARGLNYYTGAIFEVKALDTKMGSIAGGGRYDNLTGIFGLSGLSGVGISFGADRIYDVLESLDLFPSSSSFNTKILFTNLGEDEVNFCLPIIDTLRKKNFATEIYPETAKLKKQLSYANNKNIPFIAIVGSDELNNKVVSVKNMTSGEQKVLSPDELFKFLLIS